MKRHAVGLLMSALLLTSACDNDADSDICSGMSSAFFIKDRMGQEVSVFSSGERIFFEGLVSNNSSSDKMFSYGGCEAGEFRIEDQSGQSAWSGGDKLPCPAVIRTYTHHAGETRRYSDEWDQKKFSSDDAPVPAGMYTVIFLSSCTRLVKLVSIQ